jgi:6-pyruvoyltetrahydropterin/6-carboxytetrahydropterin synthase
MRIGRRYHFQAAHRLPLVPDTHKCHALHGHTYGLEVEVLGPTHPRDGWVMDYGEIDVVVRAQILAVLDHKYLNDVEGLDNPTAERICAWVWARLDGHRWPDGVLLSRVRVSENDWSWAEILS